MKSIIRFYLDQPTLYCS